MRNEMIVGLTLDKQFEKMEEKGSIANIKRRITEDTCTQLNNIQSPNQRRSSYDNVNVNTKILNNYKNNKTNQSQFIIKNAQSILNSSFYKEDDYGKLHEVIYEKNSITYKDILSEVTEVD